MATPLEHLEGKYEILEKMDEGGMGSVYKVRHLLLDEIRVIKVMRPHLADDDILRQRFIREAKVAIRLNHPGLASVYDFTMDKAGYFFLVLEFIDGMDLHHLSKIMQKMPLGMCLEIADQSLSVLGYLHSKEIVHRDISPDNLLISRDDDKQLVVKLIDLGIAKIQAEDEQLTATGAFLGKVRYSSPEHFQTQEGASISPASDIYGFGIVLYELLTGVHPIKGSNISAQIAGHLMHKLLPFDTTDPDGNIPQEMRAIIEKSTSREPSERYANCKEFQRALAPLIKKHPILSEDIQRTFEVQTLPTMKIKVKKPGSTQAKLDRNFSIDATPAHGEVTKVQQTAVTTPRADLPDSAKIDNTAAITNQMRALLLGAEKLVESKHYDEARLQLDTARALDPSNKEAGKIRKILDAADARYKNQVKTAADEIEILITAEQLDEARSKLNQALEKFGDIDILKPFPSEIDETADAIAARNEQIQNILDTARRLVAEDGWEDAVPMVREALTLDPNHSEAGDLLEIVEAGHFHWREDQRRLQEIGNTRRAIETHLENEDIKEARKALALANKLYGKDNAFSDFDKRIEEVEQTILLRRARTLTEKGRAAIEAKDFENAIENLTEASALNAKDKHCKDLLGAAREGLRLQQEAKKRQKALDDAALSIDRLILAGRLETAYHTIDATISEYGDFEYATSLKTRVEDELKELAESEAKLQQLLKAARDLSEKLDFPGAHKKIAAAEDIAAEHPEMFEMVQEAAKFIEEGGKSHRRALEVVKAAAGINKNLEAGKITKAKRELEVAERIFGLEKAFDDLHLKIKDIEQQERLTKMQELVKTALAGQSSFDDVIKNLKAALDIDPDNEAVQRLLAETQGSKQRLEQEQRTKAINEALTEIDVLIAGGDLKKALTKVNSAVDSLGDFKEARLIRHRLKKTLNQG